MDECVILSDKLFEFIKICQKVSCSTYTIIILVSSVVIVYAEIQFIIPIMPHLIIDKQKMYTSSRWILHFQKLTTYKISITQYE